MNILAVDDEYHALEQLEKSILQAVPDCVLKGCNSSDEALQYAATHRIDVAFLDIRIDDMSGLQLAQRIKELNGATNIIFVTGYDQYMRNAFQMHASGYLEKPVTPEDIAVEMEHLRTPLSTAKKGVRIQTFGNFEVYVDDQPVIFHRAKAKEALAYLVDRNGASVSKRELAAVLWENERYTRSQQSHLYKLIADMVESLKRVGAEKIVFIGRGIYSLDITKVSCDYYDYMKGDTAAINRYRGEYMLNYSWAEFTTGLLTRQM